MLERAWGEVRQNRGAAGVDGVTIDDLEASVAGEFLDRLAAGLRAGVTGRGRLGDTYTTLLSGAQAGGTFAMLEALLPAQAGPPPHIHHAEDETFMGWRAAPVGV